MPIVSGPVKSQDPIDQGGGASAAPRRSAAGHRVFGAFPGWPTSYDASVSGQSQRATLATLAEAANVHVSTASRALSTDPTIRRGVAPETVARIQGLAEQMKYRRHPAGAELRTGRSHVIGVLVPRLTDVVLATIYEGIDAAASVATPPSSPTPGMTCRCSGCAPTRCSHVALMG